MPRPRQEPPPNLAELYEELKSLAVVNPPEPDPAVPERDFASLLAFAVFYGRRLKTVVFPERIDWSRPSFEVVDDKLTVSVEWARLEGFVDLPDVLREQAARVAESRSGHVIVALDALDAEASEFEFEHALYGSAVVLAFRVRAPPTKDPRIEHARERGWVPTLKDHNLLPGRGLFTPDENFGLYLTDPLMRHVSGVQLLLPTGNFTMELNPFAKDEVNDPDLQFWLAWGRGGAASEWHDVLAVGDPEHPDAEP